MQKAWSDERTGRLIELLGRPLSAELIARELKVTRNAVIGKVYRLKLGLPGRRGAPAVVRAAQPKPRHKPVKVVPVITVPARRQPPRLLRPPAPPPPPPPGGYRPCQMGELEPGQCRWPIGDPQLPGFHFCGARRAIGPYCSAHASAAYRRHGGPGMILNGGRDGQWR